MTRILSFLALALLLSSSPALAAGPACGVASPANGGATMTLAATPQDLTAKGIYTGKMALQTGELCIDLIVQDKGDAAGTPMVTVVYLSNSGVRGSRAEPPQTLPLKDGKKFVIKLEGLACPGSELTFEFLSNGKMECVCSSRTKAVLEKVPSA